MKLICNRFGRKTDVSGMVEAIRGVVSNAAESDDIHRSLGQEIQKLTDIVAMMITRMPEPAQLELLNDVSMWKWEAKS